MNGEKYGDIVMKKDNQKKFMLKSLVSLEKLEELFYMDHQDQMKGKTEWD